jgi:hypothetical protein
VSHSMACHKKTGQLLFMTRCTQWITSQSTNSDCTNHKIMFVCMYGPSKTLLAHIHMIFASNLAPPSSYPFPRGLFKRVPVTLAGRRSQSARVTSRSVRANSGSLVCRSAPKLEPFDMVWLHRLACFVFVVCIRLGASCANLHWLTLVCISLLRFIYICIG